MQFIFEKFEKISNCLLILRWTKCSRRSWKFGKFGKFFKFPQQIFERIILHADETFQILFVNEIFADEVESLKMLKSLGDLKYVSNSSSAKNVCGQVKVQK